MIVHNTRTINYKGNNLEFVLASHHFQNSNLKYGVVHIFKDGVFYKTVNTNSIYKKDNDFIELYESYRKEECD